MKKGRSEGMKRLSVLIMLYKIYLETLISSLVVFDNAYLKYIFDFQNIPEIIICTAMFISFVSQKAFFVYFPLVGQLISGVNKAFTGLLYKRKACLLCQ